MNAGKAERCRIIANNCLDTSYRVLQFVNKLVHYFYKLLFQKSLELQNKLANRVSLDLFSPTQCKKEKKRSGLRDYLMLPVM